MENVEQSAVPVKRLVELHRAGLLSLGITTVSASETLFGTKTFPGSAQEFRERIAYLGWGDLDLILGPCVASLSYIGLSKIVGENSKHEVGALWAVMFPNVERALPKPTSEEDLWSPRFKKWRNSWCDVHTVWTHIDAKRDVLVTLDADDILKKREQLSTLGLRTVLTPEAAVAWVLS